MTVDPFQGNASALDSPARHCSRQEGSTDGTITASDSTPLPEVTRGLWVGGAGNLAVHMVGDPIGSYVLFSGVPAGCWMPLCVDQVFATTPAATTATLIVGVY